MSQNLIQFEETPIFNQLARERGYDRLIAGGPMRLYPVKPVYVQTEIQPEVEQTDEAVNAAPEGDEDKVMTVPNFWKMTDEE